jgi:hypothetical protein
MRIDKKERKFIRCGIAAKVALKYGPVRSNRINEHHFIEFSGNSQDTLSIYRNIKSSHIKWYIRNKMEIDDPIWNADFIAGIVKAGKVHWSTTQYPTFKWWGSPILVKVLEDCPYYGTIKNDKPQQEERHCYSWQKVPALYLKPTYDTASYIAGLLATGKTHVFEKQTYALYKPEVMKELERFNFRMERHSLGKPRCLISPFWPALFTKYMPESCHSYWLDINRPFKGAEYAAILWATYADSSYEFVKDGLPYLPSRRSVYYKFKNDKGTVRELQKQRLINNLFGLDKRVKECMVKWFKPV